MCLSGTGFAFAGTGERHRCVTADELTRIRDRCGDGVGMSCDGKGRVWAVGARPWGARVGLFISDTV